VPVYNTLPDPDRDIAVGEMNMLESTMQLKVLRALTLLIALTAPQMGSAGGTPMDAVPSIAAADLEHGRKLYEVSCDACHNANVHWRDKRLVDSWPTLVQQVKRWQRNSNQRWEPADITDVAAYLNERFYHLQCPPNECEPKAAALDYKDAGR
jgi:hypothetical protein